MKKLRKISSILIMAMAIAAVFTSCKKTLPTAAFTYAPETPVQYDEVQFTNTSTDATSYLWDFGNGNTFTEANVNITFLDAGDYTVKLTATNEDGNTTTEQTITVGEPDNHYMLEDIKHSITTSFFWYSSMGNVYLRLLTDVDGQDNPDLIKLFPNKGLDELPRTYTWLEGGGFMAPIPTETGTYDLGYTADYAGMTYEWSAVGKTGSGDLVIEEVETGVYRITGEMILSVGYYDYATEEFIETSTETLSINYIGPIIELAK